MESTDTVSVEFKGLYVLAEQRARLAEIAGEALDIAESYAQASYDDRERMRRRTRELRAEHDKLTED